jgi:hypothetical protein
MCRVQFRHRALTDELFVNKSDGTDECVTGGELAALLAGRTARGGSDGSSSGRESSSGVPAAHRAS